MPDRITKPQLISTLRARRAEFDAALDAVPHSTMTQPGAAGHWSAKDVVAHLAYYERWMAERMHEQLRGETYTPNEMDMMHWEPRNQLIYEKVKDLPLQQVLTESRQAFKRLMEAVEAHSEEFLTMTHHFEGSPQPVIVADMLRTEVYDHYRQHVPSLKEWAEARKGKSR
jgi:hypothetical protein